MAKKLLNEAVVRRFQSLANISPINEMYHKRDEDEKMEEAYMEGEGEEVMKEEDEMPEMGMDAEMDAEMPEEGAGEELELTDEEAEAIIALGDKLKSAMGGEMPMDDMEAEEAPEGEEMDVDAEMPEDEEEAIMEALKGISYKPSQTELVNEVAKRVAKRLAEAKKAEKRLNEALGRTTKRK